MPKKPSQLVCESPRKNKCVKAVQCQKWAFLADCQSPGLDLSRLNDGEAVATENSRDSLFITTGECCSVRTSLLNPDSTRSPRETLLPIGSTSRFWLPSLISAHAIATPNAPAIVCGDWVLTYGDLERRSNQLANRLIGLGVTIETIVAVCLGRSIESVLASLAVMKAGGAYLPLDPTQPRERLAF